MEASVCLAKISAHQETGTSTGAELSDRIKEFVLAGHCAAGLMPESAPDPRRTPGIWSHLDLGEKVH